MTWILSRFGVVLSVLGVVCPVQAQRSVPAVGRPVPLTAADGPVFTSWSAQHWTVPDGLPQDTVTSLAQTPDGYLWIGTYGGLVQFDGARFRVHDLTTTPELPSPRIEALCTDRQGRLWIAAGGIVVREAGRFRRLHDAAIDGPLGTVQALASEPGGAVWIIGNAVARSTGDRIQIVDSPLDRPGYRDLFVDGDSVWASSWQSDTLTRLGEEARPLEIDDLIRGWLVRYGSGAAAPAPGGESRPVSPSSLEPVRALCRDREGEVWLGSPAGLFVVTRGSGPPGGDLESRRVLSSIQDLYVLSLLEDRDGNLWVGTKARGLLRLSRRAFMRIEGAPLPDPLPNYCVAARTGGGWWLAAGDADLVWSLENGMIRQAFQQTPITRWTVRDLLDDPDGGVWIVVSNRLSRYGAGPPRHVETERQLYSLLRAHDGAIWCGGQGLLLRIQADERTEYGSDDGLPAGRILALSEDHEGTVWFGGSAGLGRVVERGVEDLTDVDGAPRGHVRAIHHDSDGGTWFGTYGGGFVRFKGGTFTTCSTPHGLPDNSICAIVKDERGMLWVNSNRGVFGVQESDLVAVADGRLEVAPVQTLGTPEGNGRSGARAIDGAIAFPTVSGLVTLDPVNAEIGAPPLAPVLERFASSAGEHELPGPVGLPIGVREFEVEFTSPVLTGARGALYRHRLSGYDDDWVDSGVRTWARYSKVPPGRYRFEVVAVDELGRDSMPTALEVSLPRRFFETTWFSVLSSTFAVVLMGTLYGLRVSRLKRHRRELKQEVSHRREAERAAREGWSLNQSVLAALPAHIAIVDAQGRILAVNDSWSRFAKQNGGEDTSAIGPGADYLATCRRAAIDSPEAQQAYETVRDVLSGFQSEAQLEYECSSPERQRWFVMSVTSLPSRPGAVIAHVNVTKIKEAEQEIRRMAGQLATAQEDERRRLARELHDDFSQRLAALSIDTALITRELPAGDLVTRLSDVTGRVRELSDDVHQMSHQLHPSLLRDRGLLEAVEAECQSFRRRTSIVTAVTRGESSGQPSDQAALALFRVLQEALRNVEKHSGATSVQVTVGFDGTNDVLSVRDQGRGLDEKADPGLGLRSMRERVTSLHGVLHIDSAIGEGTRVEARVPRERSQ